MMELSFFVSFSYSGANAIILKNNLDLLDNNAYENKFMILDH